MQPRLNFFPQFPQAFQKLGEIGSMLAESTLDKRLKHLIDLRVSQINGCAFCVDMHAKEAKIHGEKELRLYHVAVWSESPLFSEKEKAALNWAEKVTRLSSAEVDDASYALMKEHFSEKEIVDITMAIAMINSWNRFAATFRAVPGSQDKAYGLDKAGL